MDVIFEFLFELAVEGCMELSGNRKISPWIRYPLVALICLFFGAIIALLVYIGISVYPEEPVASVICWLLGALVLVGVMLKFRKLYLGKK